MADRDIARDIVARPDRAGYERPTTGIDRALGQTRCGSVREIGLQLLVRGQVGNGVDPDGPRWYA